WKLWLGNWFQEGCRHRMVWKLTVAAVAGEPQNLV
ncbi:hypothetical protein A2U01_0073847, partial [Trifolium medium]|nr:hypothetical protein [Trifolium medium]